MEPLTERERAELEADLLALRDELKAVLNGSNEGTRPVEPDSAIGRISRMDAIQVQQMAHANRRTGQRRLDQTAAALQRLADDEYGECADCGAEIGYRRLKARPEAPFCVRCQSRHERRA